MSELSKAWEPMFESISQNEGERISIISRGIVWKRQLEGCAIDDWDLIVDEARMILSPFAGIESEAQANLAFRSQISIID